MSAASIVCPFCPLACDGVLAWDAVEVGGTDAQPILTITCDLAARQFHAATNPSPARVGQDVVTTAELEQSLTQRIAASDRIVVISGGVDLSSSKTLERLSSDGRLTWCLEQSSFASAWQRTSGRDGVVSATLADIRQHADLLWFVGNPQGSAPRLDQVIASDRVPIMEHAASLDLDDLASLTLATREPHPHLLSPPLARLALEIESSRFFAVILGNDAFAPDDADAGSSLLVQWIWTLNRHRRAVAVYLDDAATSRSVYRWRTNRSLPTVPAVPSTLTIRIESDAATSSRCDIQFGTTDPGPGRAEHFVPCSVVGVHHRGAKVRGDGTVTLPLASIATSSLPTATQWLERLLSHAVQPFRG